MAHDSLRELQDLTTVNNFYLGLLEKSLGHSVPTPVTIQNGGLVRNRRKDRKRI